MTGRSYYWLSIQKRRLQGRCKAGECCRFATLRDEQQGGTATALAGRGGQPEVTLCDAT